MYFVENGIGNNGCKNDQLVADSNIVQQQSSGIVATPV